ncbi:MAG: tautomerase family protein, partial [bacterium]
VCEGGGEKGFYNLPMPEIIVELAEGRTLAQKRALVVALTDAVVESLGCDRAVVAVTLHEVPLEHKAKGGVLFSDRPEKVAMRDAAKAADLAAGSGPILAE